MTYAVSCQIISSRFLLTGLFSPDDSYLMVADIGGRNVFQLKPESGEIRALLLTTRMESVRAVTVDPVQNVVYMAVDNSIKMINLTGNANQDEVVYFADQGELNELRSKF